MCLVAHSGILLILHDLSLARLNQQAPVYPGHPQFTMHALVSVCMHARSLAYQVVCQR
jgi:hypothetical protein